MVFAARFASSAEIFSLLRSVRLPVLQFVRRVVSVLLKDVRAELSPCAESPSF